MQKSFVLLAEAAFMIMTAAAAPASAQAPSPADSEMVVSEAQPSADEQRVLATEDAWVQAETDRDEAALRRILDDRYVHNRNSGKLVGKEDFIQGVLHSTFIGETITDRTVLVDGNLAVTFGTAELRFHSEGGEDYVSVQRYTTTYVKRGDQWHAIALQMAKKPPARD